MDKLHPVFFCFNLKRRLVSDHGSGSTLSGKSQVGTVFASARSVWHSQPSSKPVTSKVRLRKACGTYSPQNRSRLLNDFPSIRVTQLAQLQTGHVRLKAYGTYWRHTELRRNNFPSIHLFKIFTVTLCKIFRMTASIRKNAYLKLTKYSPLTNLST